MQLKLKKYIRFSKEAEHLATAFFGVSSEKLFLDDRLDVNLLDYMRFIFAIQKIRVGVPIEYVLHKAEFAGKIFFVDENVLIPRPETELLCRKVQEMIAGRKNLKILEIGCGSGAVITTIARQNLGNTYFASDVSRSALRVAKINAKNFKIKIDFIHSDLLEKIEFAPDIIVANLPYLGAEESKGLHDPKLALVSPVHSSFLIEKLISVSGKFKNVSLALEIGHDQSALKSFALKHFPKSRIDIYQDFNGFDRVLTIQTPRPE